MIYFCPILWWGCRTVCWSCRGRRGRPGARGRTWRAAIVTSCRSPWCCSWRTRTRSRDPGWSKVLWHWEKPPWSPWKRSHQELFYWSALYLLVKQWNRVVYASPKPSPLQEVLPFSSGWFAFDSLVPECHIDGFTKWDLNICNLRYDPWSMSMTLPTWSMW